ncbi:MAG: prepilin-type N-terminal cleavage/methylation domain-containing protein [Candidatus Riflebacteria bacterium]|nr:prepilin-type N-terminal cleavage/methylation domain-containing protein [Candidatus Riflebacteria bacterium]
MRVIDRCRSHGMTLLEIMIGLVIMAVAMLPIFNMIHKSAADTDLMAAQAYAINKATEILNTCLDNVPFETLRNGRPFGYLSVDKLTTIADYQKANINEVWLDRMARMLFNLEPSAKSGKQYPCQGIVTDPRGISYLCTLRVDDVSDVQSSSRKPEKSKWGNEFPALNELTFSFCLNPEKLQDPEWNVNYDQSIKNELSLPSGIAVPTDTSKLLFYDETDFVTPNTIRYTQRHATEKVNYTSDEAFAYCTMKRLIIEVQWNLNRPEYSNPKAEDAGTQRIHLMTIKADIQR